MDTAIIPPFMVKRFKELSAIVVGNKKEWTEEIIESSMNHLQNGRAVLIITQFISEVDELHEKFKDEFEKIKMDIKKIRPYKSDHESASVKEEVNSGELLIATNIAGRGTDIRTTKSVEKNGGLHVCITFLPSNERVEQQNMGRTSRTGNLGTSQIIVQNRHQLAIDALREIRNENENLELTHAEQEMEKTLTKDEVFKMFCDLLKIVPQNTIRKAVEDRFGIWLQIHGDSRNLIQEFDEFKNKIRKELETGDDETINEVIKQQRKVIHNPCYYVILGNKNIEEEEYSEAIENFTEAIKLDEEFSEIPYYNRAYARVAAHDKNTSNHKSEIIKAVKDLEKCRERVKAREIELHLIQSAKESEDNALSAQVTHKLTLYGTYKNVIEHAIGSDEKEFQEVAKDFKEQKKELEKLKEELSKAESHSKLIENYQQQIEALNEQMLKLELELEEKNTDEISEQQIENLNTKIRSLEKYLNLLKAPTTLENLPEKLESLNETIEGHEKSKVKGVITEALETNKDLTIVLQTISESIPPEEDVELYKDEIKEFSANGALGAFQVSEIPPIDW